MSPPTSPLLRDTVEETVPLLSEPPTPTTQEDITRPKPSKPWILLVILVFFLIAIIDMGSYLADPPKTRVFEANLCLRYYQHYDPSKIHNGDVDEALCKIDAVQEKLAMIMGWQETWNSIPSLLLAVPFGTMADKIGRKRIFITSLLGIQLSSMYMLMICYFSSLPLQLTWFSSVFYIIGGGPIVAGTIALTMVSDIAPPEKRTTIFLYLTASVLVGEFLAPIMSSFLMRFGDWIPLILALIIQAIAISIGFFFPETLHLRDLPEPAEPSEENENVELRSANKNSHSIKAQLHHYKDAFYFVKRDLTLATIVLSLLANRLGQQSITLITRYASKRFHWKIEKAAYLVSLRAGANFVALLVILPLINLFLLKFVRLPSHKTDLWIARGSIIVTMVSFLIIGAPGNPEILVFGLLIYNLGTGFNASMKSVAIYAVGGQSSPDIGRLFAVIAIMESLGAMASGPLLSEAFRWGMSLGEAFLGMPFLISSLILCIISVITFMVSLKDIAAVHHGDVIIAADQTSLIEGDTDDE